MPLDPKDLQRVAPYVSNTDRNVYALWGLPEEVIAVLMAYYSRSKNDLRTNLAQLLAGDELLGTGGLGSPQATGGHGSKAQDKARSFHDKWVVGYGHASVAEHAVIHLAIEQVSILASKAIEDLRLGSYTEKSTRYVVFDTSSFADVPEFGPELGELYRSSNRRLFSTYLELMPIVIGELRELTPRADDQSEANWENAIRSHALDLLRGLLPAATLTNLGITVNARAMAMLLTKMMSSPLPEVKRLAEEMHAEALKVTPTLVRYAAENQYRIGLRELASRNCAAPGVSESAADCSTVKLVNFDTGAISRVCLALLFDGAARGDAVELRQRVEAMTSDQKLALIRQAFDGRDKHDVAPRALESASLTVQLELDYGAYRDLQRHRMLTQYTQLVGCERGATVPSELDDVGIGARVREELERAKATWSKLRELSPELAQYAVPLAYKVRTLWTMNLREFWHVVELRSSRQGHSSYRKVAQELYRVVKEVHPWVEGLVRVDQNDYRLARS